MYQHIVDSFFCTHSYTAVEWDSLYPVSPKKVVHQTHGDNFCQFSTDFHNSGKPSKFPTKPIKFCIFFPPYLQYVAALHSES